MTAGGSNWYKRCKQLQKKLPGSLTKNNEKVLLNSLTSLVPQLPQIATKIKTKDFYNDIHPYNHVLVVDTKSHTKGVGLRIEIDKLVIIKTNKDHSSTHNGLNNHIKFMMVILILFFLRNYFAESFNNP